MQEQLSFEGKEILIVSGGSLGDWALPVLNREALRIGADRGAWYLIQHGFVPDVALGDFDSVTTAEAEEIRRNCRLFLDCDPIRKDLTDTEWALDWAIARKPSSILMLGVTGTRFDHTFANIQLLKKASDAGIPCTVMDEHNEIRLLAGPSSLTLHRGRYTHISLLPLSQTAKGITLEGFLYPLTDGNLTVGQSLGISNVITAETAKVSLLEGLLLVIQSRD